MGSAHLFETFTLIHRITTVQRLLHDFLAFRKYIQFVFTEKKKGDVLVACDKLLGFD